MGKNIIKLSALKSSSYLNMQWMREEHDEMLNYSNDNNTTETIEELDKLHQISEDKEGDVM